MCGSKTASDVVDLSGFGVVEGRGTDSGVDRLGGELADGTWGAGQSKQPPGAGQHDLVVGTDGNDASHEQFERRVKTLISQRKQRRRWKRADGFTNACYGQIDVERALLCIAVSVGRGSAHTAGPYA